MNNHELRCSHKLYDLLCLRQRLDILKNINSIEVSIARAIRVTVQHQKDGISMTSVVTVDTETSPEDELDTVEYRLAYKTIEHLLGVHNGK